MYMGYDLLFIYVYGTESSHCSVLELAIQPHDMCACDAGGTRVVSKRVEKSMRCSEQPTAVVGARDDHDLHVDT